MKALKGLAVALALTAATAGAHNVFRGVTSTAGGFHTWDSDATGSRAILDFDHAARVAWDTTCGSEPCDPVGSRLVQADIAVGATPNP